MFGRIKRAIGYRIAAYCSNNTARLKADLKLAREGWDESRQDNRELQSSLEELHKVVEFYNATRQSAEQESESLAEQVAELTEERDSLGEQLRAAEASLQQLRSDLAAEQAELADTRHELDRTSKQLQIAQQENRLLAEIHETDVQRRLKEKQLEITQGEMAFTEARRYATEQQIETA